MPIVMTLLPDRPITFVVSCPTHFKLITVVSDAAVRLRDLKFVAEGCACNLGWSLVQLVSLIGGNVGMSCVVFWHCKGLVRAVLQHLGVAAPSQDYV